MEHFGVKLIKRNKQFKLTRDEFAIINTKPSLSIFAGLKKDGAYIDENGSSYTETWCKEYRELCLKNYDLNMQYFAMLDKDGFNEALDSFLNRYNRFVNVTDLSDYSRCEGYYIMVLDEYKQVYIGKSDDIRARIMKHWSITKPFDRTLFPMYAYDKSCFSIDFFRALDTTRIFVWKRSISEGIEAKLIKSFPSEYCTNRIGGDVTSGIEALATRINHNLQ